MFEKVKLVGEVGVDKREGGGSASDPRVSPVAPDSVSNFTGVLNTIRGQKTNQQLAPYLVVT